MKTIKGLKKAIKILDSRSKFLIKDTKGWNKKDKKVARTEIFILEGLIQREIDKDTKRGRKK